jgi:hypothetical protein
MAGYSQGCPLLLFVIGSGVILRKGLYVVVKKKKYVANTQSTQEEEEAQREQWRIIKEKEAAILAKYKKWWDIKKRTWKPRFEGHKVD